MATTVTPLPQLDRQSPNFRPDVNQFFGTLLPNFTVQINQVSFELMTARNETVAARNEVVPLANQVVALAPGAIAASQTVQVLAPQVAANAAAADNSAKQAQASAASAAQVAIGGSTGMPEFPPTMLNDWANSRSLDNRFTFSRGLAATAIDALGKLRTFSAGQPVFEYDASLRCRGLRVEPARTNFILQSRNLASANWPKTLVSVTASSALSPTGTAEKIVESADTGQHEIRQSVGTVAIGSTVTMWRRFRAAERTRVRLAGYINGSWSSFPQAIFDLSNGTVVAGTTSGVASGIIDVGGGWFVCWVAGILGATSAGMVINPIVGTSPTYAGDGVSGVLDSGGGYEVGIGPTSEIVTTTAAATRPADVLTLPAAATAEVLNPAQGAILVEFTLNEAPSAGMIPSVLVYGGATANDQVMLRVESSRIAAYVLSAGATVATLIVQNSVPVAGARYRVAMAYSASGLRASINGGVVGASIAPASMPVVDRLYAGNSYGVNQLNGHIAHLHPYARIPSDSELRAMSALP